MGGAGRNGSMERSRKASGSSSSVTATASMSVRRVCFKAYSSTMIWCGTRTLKRGKFTLVSLRAIKILLNTHTNILKIRIQIQVQ